MERKLIINESERGTEIAVLEDNVLVELHFNKKDEIPEGAIILGVVKEYVPSLESYFIDAGCEQKAYIPGKNVFDGKMNPGNIFPFQVVKSQRDGKGMLLSRRLLVSGKYCVIGNNEKPIRISQKIKAKDTRDRLDEIAKKNCPNGRELIIRTSAKDSDNENLEKDIIETGKKLDAIETSTGKTGSVVYSPEDLVDSIMRTFNRENDTVYFNNLDSFNKFFDYHKIYGMPVSIKYYDKEYDIFDFFSISNKIKEAKSSRVRLKCGGTLVFDYTEAMCVIDVNSSKNTGAGTFADTAVKTNLEAALEISIQLRLRNIGGIIVIDFIEVRKNEMKELDVKFREYLKQDRRRIQIGGFTAIGNYELIRMRKGRTLEIGNG